MDKILTDIMDNTSITSFGIIAVFIVAMACLSFWELISRKGKQKDFRSNIVSIGVLGTFVGIFIGLWNFDSNNISGSVPKLLDGLKTAFITSIVGMLCAVLLSIVQKFKGNAEAEDEITALNSIDKKLSQLEAVVKNSENSFLTNRILYSIDDNIKNLSSDISGVKSELNKNQERLLDFLKEKLATIYSNLKEAVQTLSRGATEEIIKALENVIQDFNNNLTDQFGDNFKLLNESVLKMIEWQESYKSSIQEFEKQLRAIFELTEQAVSITQSNAEQITNITQQYEAIAQTSKKLEEIISTNQNQIQSMESHLKAVATIGDNAKNTTENLQQFSATIQKSLSHQSDALDKFTSELKEHLPQSLDTLNKSLTSLTHQFANDYEQFLGQVRKLMQSNSLNK